MVIQDKTTTIYGAQASVSNVSMTPQPDGSVLVIATGATKDSLGNAVSLSASQSFKGVAVIDNLMAQALSVLRKANGLEV